MEIYTHVIDLKSSIPSCVTENADGSYTIFINDRTSVESRIEHYEHEIEHILHNDFEKEDVNEIESERHKGGNI